MLRLLVYLLELIVLVLVLRRLGQVILHLFGAPQVFFKSRTGDTANSAGKRTVEGKMVRDPICGMFVSTELPHRLETAKGTHYFCSQECLARYQKGERGAGARD